MVIEVVNEVLVVWKEAPAGQDRTLARKRDREMVRNNVRGRTCALRKRNPYALDRDKPALPPWARAHIVSVMAVPDCLEAALSSVDPTGTTPAPVVDCNALTPIHRSLADKGLLPAKHFVDAGYVGTDQLVASVRDHDVTLIGPTPKDSQWQARTEGAFIIQDFTFDWNRQTATYPAGRASQNWTADHNQSREVMRIRFSTDCKPCALKPQCTWADRRLLTPRRREKHAALEAARARETGREFTGDYRHRAGVEGTLSLGTRVVRLRRFRCVGPAKTHLQHVLTAAAINLGRISNWLAGTRRERTRQSAFIRLVAMPIAA